MRQNFISGLGASLLSGGIQLGILLAAGLFLTASGTAFAEDGTAGSEAEDSDVDSEVEDAERYSHFREFEHTCLLLNRFCDSAFDYFKESCDKGYDEGCIMLSRMYGQGIKSEDINVEQDSSRAEELLKHSCSRSYSRACYALVRLYHQEKKIGDAIRTLGPTIELLKKECEEWDDDGSCVLLVDIYSEKWLNIDQDLKTSLEYYSSSCENTYIEACVKTAKLYQLGLAGEEGKKEAKKIFESECTDNDNAEACSYAAGYYDPKSDGEMYGYYVGKACDGSEKGEKCFEAASHEYQESISGSDQCRPKLAPSDTAVLRLAHAIKFGGGEASDLQASILANIRKALQLYAKGDSGNCDRARYGKQMEAEIGRLRELCDGGEQNFRNYDLAIDTYGGYCSELAGYFEQKNDMKEAVSLYEKACYVDRKDACLKAARYYKAQNNAEKFRDFLHIGCELGVMSDECRALGAGVKK